MGPELEKGIHELSLRMRLLKALQEDRNDSATLSERDESILSLLADQGQMTVSEIAAANPNVSFSTISTTITKLWRDNLVSKTISPKSQRVTIVELTDKGHTAIDLLKKQRTERFNALFHAIEVTPDEKKVLIKVLARAIAFFDKYLGLDKDGKD